MLRRRCLFLGVALAAASCATPPHSQGPAHPKSVASAPAPQAQPQRRVVVFIWDGLRPDSIDPRITPELARLRDERGVNFPQHHSVYPTFTMMNAAALATGVRSAHHGFYGNDEYQPGPSGTNAKGKPIDFTQPFFSEDHALLQALDAYYRERGTALLRVQTLFERAHAAGLRTATIGKAGPAFIQDYRQDGTSGVVLDENVVLPYSFARALQAAGFPLPKHTVHQRYPEGTLQLAADNGDPTAPTAPVLVTLEDGATPDPRAASGSPHKQRNAYLMRVFLEYVLPQLDPALSVIWLRNPDSTQHTYGPGTPNAIDALRHQDLLLGELLRTLERLGRSSSTDLLIASDHGHSTIGSDRRVFPQRQLLGAASGEGKLGPIADPGYFASGDIRSADWLRRAGFAHSYDGSGCVFNPVMSGIRADGLPVYATHEDAQCVGLTRTTTGDFRVPQGELAPDAIIVAANGGSEYFYVPSSDSALVQRLVTTLQERRPYGPIFVRARYGALAGTLPFERVGLESAQSVSPPMPDVVASFAWNDSAQSLAAANTPGSEHASAESLRGMHGSFSPVDVHNTLIAIGPDFRAGYRDEYPTSTLDIAPTVAALLGLSLPHAEGRVLREALTQGETVQHRVEAYEEHAGPVPLERTCDFDDPDCKRPARGLSYAFTLRGQTLHASDGRTVLYLDQAQVTRAPAQAPASQPPRTATKAH